MPAFFTSGAVPPAPTAAPLDQPGAADMISVAGLSGPLLVVVAIASIIGVLLVINRLPKR